MAEKGPVLVILAAGVGSRYGGLKQMDRIGGGGEALLDYSVFDALRSGFTKIIFIIRHEIEADFRKIVLSRMGSKVPYELAFQEHDSFIPKDIVLHAKSIGRTKPWGTAHALLCAAGLIDAPFCVINADDFYGKEAFAVMGNYLAESGLQDGAIVPYKLSKTLSPRGKVTRGVCSIQDGCLTGIEELKALERASPGLVENEFEDGTKRSYRDDTPVSMNFWGFPSGILPHFKMYFESFILSPAGKEPKSECYLPLAADKFIKDGILKIRSLDADASWFGVTYKEDLPEVKGEIEALTKAGIYPERLWNAL